MYIVGTGCWQWHQISPENWSEDLRHTPKTILQLYNSTWVHHQLCLNLFPSPKEKQHNGVLWDLLACLSGSFSTSEWDCLFAFSQYWEWGKDVSVDEADSCQNHKLSSMECSLLHLQAKQLAGQLSQSLEHGESRVKKAWVGVTPFSGTVVSRDFVQSRSGTYQASLSCTNGIYAFNKHFGHFSGGSCHICFQVSCDRHWYRRC